MKKNLEIYTKLTIAAFLLSAAIQWIFNAEQIVPGGVTGIGIIIENITSDISGVKIPVWLTNIVINIPLFICGYRILDRESMIKTVYTTVASTVFMAAIPEVPLVTGDRLLNMITGGTMLGISYGIMFRNNSSSGGVDLIALIINKSKPYIRPPVILGIIDVIIVAAGGIAFGIENMLYAIIAILISAKLSDRIIQGFRQGKIAYIISSHCEEIRKYIINDIKRGVTLLDTRGGYANDPRVMIISVLSSRELVKLKDKIMEIDDEYFLIITSVTEVFGEGFTNLTR
jgi:uncharacterized membrane-anchored protein YitT (DUF2179 family)